MAFRTNMKTKGRPKSWPKEGLATADEAAMFLRVCLDTIYRRWSKGQLPCVSVGRLKRIRWEDLHAISN